MANKTLDLIARIHSAGMTQGGQQGVTALNAIKRAALAAGAAIAGAFASRAIIANIRATSVAGMVEERAFRSLTNAMEAAGVSAKEHIGFLAQQFAATQKITEYGDTDQADSLRTLLVLTGNYQKSIAALPLVLRLAETGLFDLQTAAMMVSKGLAGNTLALTRYFPALKGSNDVLGDLEKQLNKTQGTLGTFSQSLNRMQNVVVDIREAGGMMLNEFLRPFLDDLSVGLERVRDFTDALVFLKPPKEWSDFAAAFDKDALLGTILKHAIGTAGDMFKNDRWLLGQFGDAMMAPGTLFDDVRSVFDEAEAARKNELLRQKLEHYVEVYNEYMATMGPPIGPEYWHYGAASFATTDVYGAYGLPSPTKGQPGVVPPTGGLYGYMLMPSVRDIVRNAPELPQGVFGTERYGLSERELWARNREKKAKKDDEIEDMQKAIGEEFSSIMSSAIITAFDEGGGVAVKRLGKQLRDNIIGNLTDALFKGFGSAIGGGPLSILFGSGKLL